MMLRCQSFRWFAYSHGVPSLLSQGILYRSAWMIARLCSYREGYLCIRTIMPYAGNLMTELRNVFIVDTNTPVVLLAHALTLKHLLCSPFRNKLSKLLPFQMFFRRDHFCPACHITSCLNHSIGFLWNWRSPKSP